MAGADSGLAAAAAGDALTGTGHAAVEVHAVDTDGGVVLDTEIDVLADTETEVASLGEVALAELVLLDLEAALENLLGLGAADRDVHRDLFVTADTERADCVAGLAWGGVSKSKIRMSIRGATHCRPGSARKAAPAPWPHGSVCRQTRRPRCLGRASGCGAPAWRSGSSQTVILLAWLALCLQSMWSHHDGGVVDFPVLGVVDELEIWKGEVGFRAII